MQTNVMGANQSTTNDVVDAQMKEQLNVETFDGTISCHEPKSFISLSHRRQFVRAPKSAHTELSCRTRRDYFTVSAFVRPKEAKEAHTILHLDRVSNLQFWMFLCELKNNKYKLVFGVDYYGVGWNMIGAVEAVPLNKWTHVCGVKDDNNIILYVNGIEVHRAPQTNDCPLSRQDWYIGQNLVEPHFHFVGDIAHVALWRRSLTPSQIYQLATQNEVPQQELRFYYPLNEARGTIAKDCSRYQNHGQVLCTEFGSVLTSEPLKFDNKYFDVFVFYKN